MHISGRARVNRSRRSDTALKLSLGMWLLMCGAHANAGAWDWSARAALNSEYKDNPTLRDDDEDIDSTFNIIALYAMDMRWAEQNKSFRISPKVTRDYYPDRDQRDLESTDYFIPGQFTFSMPTVYTDLTFDVRRQNILSDATTILGSADTSNFRADDTQDTYSVGGTLIWSPTERDQISFSGSAAKIDYDLDFTGRSDYDFYSANASWSRSVTPRQRLGLTAAFNRFTSEGDNCLNFGFPLPDQAPCGTNQIKVTNDSDTDSYGLTLDYRFQLTEILELNARFGRQTSDSTTSIRDIDGNFLLGPTDTDADSDIYDIGLSGQYERGSFTLGGSRSISPSSTGSAQDRTELSFNGDYGLSRTLTTGLTLRVLEEQSVLREDDNTPGGDRKLRYYTGDIRMRWAISRDWYLNGGYQYRWRDRDEAPGLGVDSEKATSKTLRLGVTYYFRRLRR